VQWLWKAGSGGPGSQLAPLPLKFEAAVRNCMWRLCRTGVKVMAMTAATCLTLIHQRPCACIHIQRNKDNMTCCELSHVPGKIDFDPPVKEWFPRACRMVTFSSKCSVLEFGVTEREADCVFLEFPLKCPPPSKYSGFCGRSRQMSKRRFGSGV